MKTSLVVFGVLFLALGILLYVVPVQRISADTTTGTSGTVTSSAVVTVPVGWAYTSGAIGAVLFILGLVAPGSNSTKVVPGPRGPRGKSAKRRYYKRSAPRRYTRSTLPRGTSVTTTIRTKR